MDEDDRKDVDCHFHSGLAKLTRIRIWDLVVLVNHEIENGLQLVQGIVLVVGIVLDNDVVTKVLQEGLVARQVVIDRLALELLVIFDGLNADFEQLERYLVDRAVLVSLGQHHLLEDVLQDSFFEANMFSENVDVWGRRRE